MITHILVTADNKDELIETFSHTLIHISNQFQANWLVLNLTYIDKFLSEVETVRFVILQTDNEISWKCHVSFLVKRIEFCVVMR
jgi:hypothetical protein